MTIVEFILARVAGDEAAAKTASGGPWEAFRARDRGAGPDWIGVTRDLVVDYDPDVVSSQQLSVEDAEHIARHDPARVLAECAALRAVVELHSEEVYRFGVEIPTRRPALSRESEATLRALAAIWAGHESYDPNGGRNERARRADLL